LLSLDQFSNSVFWVQDISSDDRDLQAKERAP
jgi:hypothetical protein